MRLINVFDSRYIEELSLGGGRTGGSLRYAGAAWWHGGLVAWWPGGGGPLVCHVVVLEIRDSGEGSLPPSEIRSSTRDSAPAETEQREDRAKKSPNSIFPLLA